MWLESIRRSVACALVVLCSLASSAFAQTPATDCHIEWAPMRDGVKLATEVYLPTAQTGRLPVVLQRTPYNRFPPGPGSNCDSAARAAKAALSQLLPGPGGKRLYGVRCRTTGNLPVCAVGRYTSVASFTPSRIGAHSMWQSVAGVCANAELASEQSTTSAQATLLRIDSSHMSCLPWSRSRLPGSGARGPYGMRSLAQSRPSASRGINARRAAAPPRTAPRLPRPRR